MTTDVDNQEYLNQGIAASKEGNYQQAVFWFLQHKAFVSKGDDFYKLKRAIKKCQNVYPAYPGFVRSLYKGKKIKEDTTFTEVNKEWEQWLKALQDDDDDDDANVDNLEALKANLLIDDEIEELHLQASCQIKKSDSDGYGVLVEISGKKGILTDSKCLSDEKDCQNASLSYENADDGLKEIEFDPDIFKISEKTGVVFVGFKYGKDMMSVSDFFNDYSSEKLEGEGKDNDGKAHCYTFYYVNKEKCITDFMISAYNDESGILKIDNFPDHTGLPVYMGNQLLGLNTEKGILSISKIRLSLGLWITGDIVTAKWTDGHPYKAKLLEQTEGGWKVKWEGFNEEGQIQETDIVESQ